jgi:hypothetical protein
VNSLKSEIKKLQKIMKTMELVSSQKDLSAELYKTKASKTVKAI